MEDQEAIRRMRSGDIDGLEVLVRRYQLPALGAAFLITHDHALAEDIVQEAFLRVYERIGQFDINRPFRPWFLRSVVNAAIKASTRRERQVSLDQARGDTDDTLLGLLADSEPGPDDLSDRNELRRTVWSALGRLTATQRALVIQRYYLDMSEAEIATVSARSRGTIKWHLYAARERLREVLAPLWQVHVPTEQDK